MHEPPKRAGGKRNAQEAQLDSPTDAQLTEREELGVTRRLEQLVL